MTEHNVIATGMGCLTIFGWFKKMLGHSSIQTTQIYVHTDVDERRKAYQEYFPRL